MHTDRHKEVRSFPNESEKVFLNYAYNRWLNLFEEYAQDNFYKRNKKTRFLIIRDMFLVYSEILNYEPIGSYLKWLKKNRPLNEEELSRELFVVIRHLLSHFPFWNRWDDVVFNKDLVCWGKKHGTIHRFLVNNEGRDPIKFRIWNPTKKTMTYMEVNFPQKYSKNDMCYLKDILSEKDGILLAVLMMNQVVSSQIESIKSG